MGRWLWGSGRVGRATYWIGFVGLGVAGWIFHALAMTAAYILPEVFPYIGGILIAAVGPVAWSAACLIRRRLHDLGRSGWLQLGAWALLLAGLSLGQPGWPQALGLQDDQVGAVLHLTLAAYLAFVVLLGLPQGSAALNRYGPPTSRTR